MKKHIIFLVTLLTFASAHAAPQTHRVSRNQPQSGGTTTAVSARSAISARSAKPTTNTPSAARSATAGRTTISRGDATSSGSATTAVTARAGATQKVVGTGTKVATATQNTAVDQSCQQKFNGCMDTFCMIENASGGRCQCSNQNNEFAKELEEIEKLNQQSYKLATVGVETIETGVNITAVTNQQKKSLDLSKWNAVPEDVNISTDSISNLSGNALQNKAAELCLEKIPECAASATALRTMYNQQVRNDCTAYKNAIKQERTAAESRLAEAQKAMRSAAYEKLQSSNKYDLGQCTVEFKKCMASTGGCGDDFAACASVAASDNTNVRQSTSKKAKNYTIKGSVTNIEISASTYDTLESKKPLCDSVLNSCQNVRDQVWGTFLRETAPQLRNAELIAENNARQDCIGNISACFQKACKDNIDPKDPDGSYDMCLSRPETMLNVCKVPLNACGIDASSAAKAQESQIWGYVEARLAAMRVDACTTEVKECLQSDDRCGKDYTACVGLDTDTIVRMCPYDKLTGCQKVYAGQDIRGDAVYDELATMVQGIMLNIDNNLLDYCQNAANESMIRACGDTENCDTLVTDDRIGAGSLNYGICYYNDTSIDYSKCFSNASQVRDVDLGRIEGATSGELGPVVPLMAVIDGTMFWELVTIDDTGKLTGADEYFNLSGSTQMLEPTKELVKSQLSQLQTSIDSTVQTIESDPTVQYCMTGRKVQGMKDAPVSSDKTPRFPQLTRQIRSKIATSALKSAKANYYTKYNELYERQMKDYVELAERQAKIKGENAKDARREAARISCVQLADAASLPMSPPPPNGFGMWLVAGIVTVIGAVVTVVSFGAAGAPVGAGLAALWGATVTTASSVAVSTAGLFAVGGALSAAGVAAAAGAATAIAGTAMLVSSSIAEAAADHSKGGTSAAQRELSGHHELDQWNWKQTIDTTYSWDSMNCHKCVRTTKCVKQSYPLFGSPKCKQWSPSTEECTDTQF